MLSTKILKMTPVHNYQELKIVETYIWIKFSNFTEKMTYFKLNVQKFNRINT